MAVSLSFSLTLARTRPPLRVNDGGAVGLGVGGGGLQMDPSPAGFFQSNSSATDAAFPSVVYRRVVLLAAAPLPIAQW